jgi:formylglycine-generating enzyme required for sulfatase activity
MPATHSAFAQLAGTLSRARAQTDFLFGLLPPAAFYLRPIPERHRLIFYLGHLEAFDWNLLCRRTLGMPSFHPTFDKLFEFGIDPSPGQLPRDEPSDWPAIEEIRTYNSAVRRAIDRMVWEVPDEILHVAAEHRWMHAETLAYLFHRLPLGTLPGAPSQEQAFESRSRQDLLVEIPAGTVRLGQARGNGFGWDNEFEEHNVHVPAFSILKYKVTNGEFLEFVRAGGTPPPFWTRRNTGSSEDGWMLRTMFEEVPLPLDWPVYTTHEQASAFATWSGGSLPTEAQYHRAAFGTLWGEERDYPWGSAQPSAEKGNFDFIHWDPVPVDRCPSGDSAFGVSQLCGNGWEWTSTVFAPFRGFEPAAYYPNYSEPFFDGEHYVLKGASPRTAAPLLRRSFRNWFRPAYPYVYGAFRCVRDA